MYQTIQELQMQSERKKAQEAAGKIYETRPA